MKFPLMKLYILNRSKPLVLVDGNEEWIQCDYCDLDGFPPERIGTRGGVPSMTDMGKLPQGQYENLPEVFEDIQTSGKLDEETEKVLSKIIEEYKKGNK